MRIRVCDRIPSAVRVTSWDYSVIGLSPSRLRLAQDARYTDLYVVATDAGGDLLAIMPAYQSRVEQTPYREYDPHLLTPGLAMARDPRGWLLLGGRRDLCAGIAVRAGLPAPRAASIRAEVVSYAVEWAREAGLVALALYVRDREVDAFRGVFGEAGLHIVAADATLPVVGTTDEGYLRSLTARRRAGIRRDWRRFAELGLVSQVAAVGDVIDAAADLVVNVKRRFDIPDHPRLVRLRLRKWAECGAGTCVAFAVRDVSGELIGVSFCCDDGSRLEHYEIGLTDTSPARLAAYLEVGFYAPLRYAQAHRLSHIELGLDAPFPKRERGAIISPVWMAADPAGVQSWRPAA